MFGSVSADINLLTEDEKKAYQGYYCGLCRALNAYGLKGRLTLNYDMSFLYLFLSSYFNEDEEKASLRCIAHPAKKRCVYMNKYAEYASDMNILLTYYKLIDDVNDESSIRAKASEKLLKKCFLRARAKHENKNEKIKAALDGLYEIEKRDEHNPDIPAKKFGELMGILFDIYGNDPLLYEFGCNLGKVVYIMDACIDLKDDIKRLRYNPMVEIRTEKFQQILTILLSDCTNTYDKMNIVKNKSIIDNILYSGILQKFWRKYK